MLKLLVSNMQNLQNNKFYGYQNKLVYSMLLPGKTVMLNDSAIWSVNKIC